MLRLFIKDNTNGNVHEYGESSHDALILQEDGSIHYENMQNCCGTMFPEEGYSFCLEDGTVPPLYDPEREPYLDIGGEYYTKPKTNADRIRAWNDHELAETIANFVSEIDNGDVRYSDDSNDWLKWLQQPVED